MSYDPEPIIKRYLQLLDRDLGGLPRARRREVVEEIAEHIARAQEDSPVESEAELLNLLERIGAPEEIAAESRERFGISARSRWQEITAIVLLLLGGFLFGIGWVVGLVLLWTSTLWKLRDKLIGTLILPGGLAFSLGFLLTGVGSSDGSCGTEQPLGAGGQPLDGLASTCSDGSGVSALQWMLAATVLIAPILTTIYLSLRLRAIGPHVPAGTPGGDARFSLNAVGWIVLLMIVILFAFVWLASQTLIPSNHG
jgi:hypothetical protein